MTSTCRATLSGSPFAFMAAVLLVGCDAPTGAGANRIAIGLWGGDHMRLDVLPGSASIEYDCAHGTIDQPLVSEPDGRFTAVGTHTFESGGPIRIDAPPPKQHPARYEGRVNGNTLRLMITATDTQQTVGEFTATFGAAGRLLKCL